MIRRYRQDPHNNDFRARLFHELATLERVGIPVLQALPSLSQHSSKEFQLQIKRMLSFMRGGMRMSEAGRRSGVWLPWEASLLAVAENSGRRELFYQRLASHYSSRATRERTLKNRLWYPYAILLIAIILGPLPALARGDIDGIGYIIRTISPIALLFGTQALITSSYWNWRAGSKSLPTLLLVLPYFRCLQQRDSLALFALLLSTGIAAQDACRLLQRDLLGAWIQSRLQKIQTALEQGETVTNALSYADLIPDSMAEQILRSGEHAGRLEETLEHVIAGMDRHLENQLDTLAEWLPRLLYALIVGFVISRLLL